LTLIFNYMRKVQPFTHWILPYVAWSIQKPDSRGKSVSLIKALM
jgi:hypothetical protein